VVEFGQFMTPSGRHTALAFVAYVILAAIQSWPLPLHMATQLTGTPAGDAGVYVWNIWVFSHQIFSTGTTPMSTLDILPLAGGPTDLSLHNYTLFSDVIAVPFLGLLGVVRTFNLIYLFNSALVGFGLFLLARRLTGRVAESFVAGLVFAWAPFIITRGDGHFSLAAAAPLPIFMLMLCRAFDSQRLRDALLAGAVMAWAAFSDPYYGVYCVMLGGCFVVSRALDVSIAKRPVNELRAARYLIDIGFATTALLVIGVQFASQGVIHVGIIRFSMHTLYTPMLVLTALAVARLAVSTDLRITTLPTPTMGFLVRATVACAVVAGVLMSPTLYAVGRSAVMGDVPSVPVLWRSSAPGVDLLAFFIPNPNHPLAPASIVAWLTNRSGGYLEQVASLSLVGLAILFAARRLTGFRLPRFWLVITVGFGLLALGPFLEIAGVNTQIPTPWALLRYVPLIGAARMPARFAVVTAMGFSMMVAFALAALTARFPKRRLAILTVAGVAIAGELIAAPRPLYSAEIPGVYQIIAADSRPVRVLELPTGVRDGLSSMGDFNARAQFYQTFHGKGLIGGYLSRVAPSVKSKYRRMPVTSALIDVSAGQKLSARQIERAIAGADGFIRATNLGYVVMQRASVSDDVRDFATILLGLVKIAEADGYDLYVPRQPAR
jgi:hypothetical protein